MNWLITAFEPFAGRKQNNSMLVLEEIKKLEPEIHSCILPVSYKNSFKQLDQKVSELLKAGIPLQGILALGEGAEEFKLETQARNCDDVPELPDNDGETRSAQKIFPELPSDATFALRFPFEAFSRIRSSTHAGYFVCNHLCAEMSKQYTPNPSIPYFGFIHVPKIGSGGLFTADVCAAVIVSSLRKVTV